MNTKAQILLFILVFYAVVGVFYGLYGDMVNDETQLEYAGVTETQESNGIFKNIIKDATGTDTTGFFKDAVTGIKDAPSWINIIVFIPLFLVLIYLMLPTY